MILFYKLNTAELTLSLNHYKMEQDVITRYLFVHSCPCLCVNFPLAFSTVEPQFRLLKAELKAYEGCTGFVFMYNLLKV